MVVSLVLVRVALRILGESQFAVFQVLIAALAWFTLSSLGLGPALKNLVSEYRARGEPDQPLRAAATVLGALLFVVGAALVGILAPTVTNGLLRKLSHDQVWAFRAFLIGGMLSLITALGQVGLEVLYAEFRAGWVYALSIGSSAVTLLAVGWIGHLDLPRAELVFCLVCATIGPQAVAGTVGLGMTRLLTLRLRRPSRAVLHRIAALALRFGGYILLTNLSLAVDSLLISQILVARDIVVYAIMTKVITVGLVLFTTVISVAWPEWTHHWELRQFATLRRRVLTLAVTGVAICVPGAIFAVFALPAVLQLWLPDAGVAPSTALVVLFVTYLAVRLWTDVHSSALMAGNRIRPATAFAVCQALVTGPLEYLGGRMWGPEGVILGLLVGILVTGAWLFPWRFYGEIGMLETGAPVTAGDRGVA